MHQYRSFLFLPLFQRKVEKLQKFNEPCRAISKEKVGGVTIAIEHIKALSPFSRKSKHNSKS